MKYRANAVVPSANGSVPMVSATLAAVLAAAVFTVVDAVAATAALVAGVAETIGREPLAGGRASLARYFMNFGSVKYRLKLTNYK